LPIKILGRFRGEVRCEVYFFLPSENRPWHPVDEAAYVNPEATTSERAKGASPLSVRIRVRPKAVVRESEYAGRPVFAPYLMGATGTVAVIVDRYLAAPDAVVGGLHREQRKPFA
jgi:hypothetical protein